MTPASGRAARAGKPASGRGRFAASFVRGYRNRNPLVLAAALLLLVAALMGLDYVFTSGAWSDVPLKYWLRKSSDDWVYVSWTVGRNKQDPPDKPTIYILGGSSARESITNDRTLERAIRRAGGPDTGVFNLGSANQNFGQSLAIIDNVPDTPATVIVGLNPNRFFASRGLNQKQAKGIELLLESDALRDYVRKESGHYKYTTTIIPGILAYATSYVQEHKRELLEGKIPEREYGQHRYNLKYIHTDKQKREMVTKWNAERSPIVQKWMDYNLALLDELLKRAEERGVQVVLLELPWNRDIVGHGWDRDFNAYRPRAQALAEKYGVPYVDFNEELGIPNKYFHDISHLVEPGRVIWERRLAKELAKLLGADGASAVEVAAAP